MKNSLWVVYRMGSHGKFCGGNAVCDQREWDAMEGAHPGSRTLIQEGIASEGEAERVARTSPLLGNTPETSESDPQNSIEAETEAIESDRFETEPSIPDSSSVVATPAAPLIGSDDLLLPVYGEAG